MSSPLRAGERYVTVEEAAAQLSMSPAALRQALRRDPRLLETVRIGRRIRVVLRSGDRQPNVCDIEAGESSAPEKE